MALELKNERWRRKISDFNKALLDRIMAVNAGAPAGGLPPRLGAWLRRREELPGIRPRYPFSRVRCDLRPHFDLLVVNPRLKHPRYHHSEVSKMETLAWTLNKRAQSLIIICKFHRKESGSMPFGSLPIA